MAGTTDNGEAGNIARGGYPPLPTYPDMLLDFEPNIVAQAGFSLAFEREDFGEEELYKLLNREWSRDHFDLSRSVLRDVKAHRGSSSLFGKKKYNICNQKFNLYSVWNEGHRNRLIAYFRDRQIPYFDLRRKCYALLPQKHILKILHLVTPSDLNLSQTIDILPSGPQMPLNAHAKKELRDKFGINTLVDLLSLNCNIYDSQSFWGNGTSVKEFKKWLKKRFPAVPAPAKPIPASTDSNRDKEPTDDIAGKPENSGCPAEAVCRGFGQNISLDAEITTSKIWENFNEISAKLGIKTLRDLLSGNAIPANCRSQKDNKCILEQLKSCWQNILPATATAGEQTPPAPTAAAPEENGDVVQPPQDSRDTAITPDGDLGEEPADRENEPEAIGAMDSGDESGGAGDLPAGDETPEVIDGEADEGGQIDTTGNDENIEDAREEAEAASVNDGEESRESASTEDTADAAPEIDDGEINQTQEMTEDGMDNNTSPNDNATEMNAPVNDTDNKSMKYDEWNQKLIKYFFPHKDDTASKKEVFLCLYDGYVLKQISGFDNIMDAIVDFICACTDRFTYDGVINVYKGIQECCQETTEPEQGIGLFCFFSLTWQFEPEEGRADMFYPRVRENIRWAKTKKDGDCNDAMIYDCHGTPPEMPQIKKLLLKLAQWARKQGYNVPVATTGDKHTGYPRYHARKIWNQIEKLYQNYSNGKTDNSLFYKAWQEFKQQSYVDTVDDIAESSQRKKTQKPQLYWDINNGEIALVIKFSDNAQEHKIEYTTSDGNKTQNVSDRICLPNTGIQSLTIDGKNEKIPTLPNLGTPNSPIYIFYLFNEDRRFLLKRDSPLKARNFIVYGIHNRLTLNGQEQQPKYTGNNYKRYDLGGLICAGGELRVDETSITCGFDHNLVIVNSEYSDYSADNISGVFLFREKKERNFIVRTWDNQRDRQLTITPNDYNRPYQVEIDNQRTVFFFAVPDESSTWQYSDELFRRGRCMRQIGETTFVCPIEEFAFAWQTGLNELRDFNQIPGEEQGQDNKQKLDLQLHIFVQDDQSVEILLNNQCIRTIKQYESVSIRNILENNDTIWQNQVSLEIRQTGEEKAKHLLTLDVVPSQPYFFQENQICYLFPANLPENPTNEDKWSIWIAQDGPPLSATQISPETLNTEIIRGKRCYRLDINNFIHLENDSRTGGGTRLSVWSEEDFSRKGKEYELFPIQDDFDYARAQNELEQLCRRDENRWKRCLFSQISERQLTFIEKERQRLISGTNIFAEDIIVTDEQGLEQDNNQLLRNILSSLSAIRRLEIRKSQLPGLEGCFPWKEHTGLYYHFPQNLEDQNDNDFNYEVMSNAEKLLCLPQHIMKVEYRQNNQLTAIYQATWGRKNQHITSPIFLSLPQDQNNDQRFFQNWVQPVDVQFHIQSDNMLKTVWDDMGKHFRRDHNNSYANLSKIFSLIWEIYKNMSNGRKMILTAAVYSRMFAWHKRFLYTFPLQTGKDIIYSFVKEIWQSNNNEVLKLFAADILMAEFFFTWCNDPRYNNEHNNNMN